MVNRLRKRGKSRHKRPRRRRTAGGVTQYATLVRRGLTVKFKDVWNTGILLLQAPLIALLIGLVFGPKVSDDVTVDNFSGIASATATTMFLLGISALWFGCSNAARDIVAESAIYRRERMVGLGIPSYVASKVTNLAMLCLFQCAVLLGVVGLLCRLTAPWGVLYASLFLASMVGVAIGLAISGAARTGEVAAGVLPLVILPMVILGGILLPLHELPKGPVPMRALASVMPSRWAFECLLIPEAESRIGIDTSVTPPALVAAGAKPTQPEQVRTDMAEAFFKSADRKSGLGVVPFVVLMIEASVLLLGVGVLLLSKDFL